MILYWIILILLIIVIVLAIVRISVASKETVEKTISSSSLKTGDILFVSYKNTLGTFMKAWSFSKWTHTAMVYKSPDEELYVMETANYPDIKGVLFLPIAEWYRYNKHCEIAVKKLHKPTHFDDTKVLQAFEKLVDKKLDTFGTSWLRLLTKKEYASLEDKQNITCYELVIHLLQEMNVVKKEKSPSSYFPKDIVRNYLPLHKNFSFSELHKLKM
jgi:hypothetical protein